MPPVALMDMMPLALPQVALVACVVAVNMVGSEMVNWLVVVHPLASVTITL